MPMPIATDGLPARMSGPWAAEKLDYISRYMDIFCVSMRDKWRLVYADLFSGPGLAIDRSTHHSHLGSPLLAASRDEFQALFLNDIDPIAVNALKQRVPPHIDHKLRITNEDCNSVIAQARDFLFPSTLRQNTLGLAVIDPTAYQINLSTLEELTRDVRMDLIITYMTDHFRRFASTPEFRQPIGRFLGDPDWWKSTVGQDDTTTYHRLLSLYHRQLQQIGYSHFAEPVVIRNSNRRVLYHIVFASRHRLGFEFAKKISQRNVTGQRRLFE